MAYDETVEIRERKAKLVSIIRAQVVREGKNLNDVDRILDRTPGYTSQVLTGHRAFRVDQLFEILGALEASPLVILSELYDDMASRDGAEKVVAMLEEKLDRAVDAVIAGRNSTKEGTADG